MYRCILLSTACFVVAFVQVAPIAAGDDRSVLEKIRDDWQKRQDRPRIVEYELVGKRLLAKGSMNYEDAGRTRQIPSEDVILDKKAKWLLDFKNNRFRREVLEYKLDENLRPFPRFIMDSFDGEKQMYSYPSDKNPGQSASGNEADIAIVSNSHDALLPLDYPLFIAHGMVPTRKKRPHVRQISFANTAGDFLVHTRATHNGVRCVVLRSTSNEDPDIIECWVDPSREHAVVKWIWLSHDKIPILSIDLDYQSTSVGWLAKSWTSAFYMYDSPRENEANMVEQSETMKIEHFEIEPVVDRSDFELKLTPGQNFSDVPNKKRYRVQTDGSLKEFDPSFPPVDDNKNNWLRVLAIIGACVIVFLIAWRILVKKSGSSS